MGVVWGACAPSFRALSTLVRGSRPLPLWKMTAAVAPSLPCALSPSGLFFRAWGSLYIYIYSVAGLSAPETQALSAPGARFLYIYIGSRAGLWRALASCGGAMEGRDPAGREGPFVVENKVRNLTAAVADRILAATGVKPSERARKRADTAGKLLFLSKKWMGPSTGWRWPKTAGSKLYTNST